MAEEHQIEARILLRYDTYLNWINSNLILKRGEMAIATFPERYTIAASNVQPENTPPAVGLKVGDGQHYFYELPWVQGVAADVYAWAKQQTKPIYNANEIEGLAAYIETYAGSGGGGSGGSGSYRIIYDSNNNKYILQQYNTSTEDWDDTASEINLSNIINRIAALENWANGSLTDIGNIEQPLLAYVSEAVSLVIGRLNVTDTAVDHQFVTSVSETAGKISVQRKALNTNDITSGVFPTERGGTGFSSVNVDEILVGSQSGNLRKTNISTTINDDENTNNIPTTGAVRTYINQKTAGLTGAMHFIGEASVTITENSNVNPQIVGYNFRLAQPGDVILFEAKEFVWTGNLWQLLGDEGSYAVKGSISNSDIIENANISISKIANLADLLNNKVDKVEGKALSSNDFTNEYKQKLENIEENAQRNLIEHIYINGTEAIPSVIEGKANSLSIRLSSLTPEEEEKLRGIENGAQVNLIEHVFLNENELPIKTVKELAKSVQIELIEYTEEEKQKLAEIETGAQKNTIETVSVNGSNISPSDKNVNIEIPNYENKIEVIKLNGTALTIEDKAVNIQMSKSALNFTLLDGARVPTELGNTYEAVDTTVQENARVLNLARIAKTGSIYDITNTSNKYIISNEPAIDFIILNCGSAETLIDNITQSNN